MRTKVLLPALAAGLLCLTSCDVMDMGGFQKFTHDFHYSYPLHAGGKLADGFQLLGLPELALHCLVLGNVFFNGEKMRDGSFRVLDGRNRHRLPVQLPVLLLVVKLTMPLAPVGNRLPQPLVLVGRCIS